MRIDRRVCVKLKVNSRNNAGCNRHPFASERIAVGRNDRFKLGNSAKLQRNHVLEETRRRHIEDSQVTIVGNELDGGRISIRIAVALHRDVAAVADDVRVCHDPRTINDEPGADTTRDGAGVPRCLVIGLNRCRRNSDQTFLNRSVGPRRRYGNGDNRGGRGRRSNRSTRWLARARGRWRRSLFLSPKRRHAGGQYECRGSHSFSSLGTQSRIGEFPPVPVPVSFRSSCRA